MALLDFIKKPLDILSGIAEERMKHPFVGSFMISWLLFNWKPIVYLLISSGEIDAKIKFMELNYSSITYLFWLPLGSAIFYVIVLPHLSWVLDWILQKSVSNRIGISTDNQLVRIRAKRVIAIENLETEKKQAEFRDQKNTNELISGLEKKVIDLEEQNKHEKETNELSITNLKEQHNKELLNYVELMKNDQEAIAQAKNDVQDLNLILHAKEREIEVSKLSNEAGELEITDLSKKYELQNKLAEELQNTIYNLTEKIRSYESEISSLTTYINNQNLTIRGLENERDRQNKFDYEKVKPWFNISQDSSPLGGQIVLKLVNKRSKAHDFSVERIIAPSTTFTILKTNNLEESQTVTIAVNTEIGKYYENLSNLEFEIKFIYKDLNDNTYFQTIRKSDHYTIEEPLLITKE